MHYPHPIQTCLVILAVSLSSTAVLSAQIGDSAAPVEVSRVVSTRQLASKSFIGSLVPLKRSPIGSAVDGRVTKMLVEEGDAVSVDPTRIVNGQPLGQPLVQLRTVLLDIELDSAAIELRLRQYEESELLETLPTEIQAAESAVEEIKARLTFARTNLERLQRLSDSNGAASINEVDQADSTFRSQKQLNARTEALLKRLVLTRESRLKQANAKVEAQRAAIRRLEELKEDYTIRAPFDGYVTAKNTELGQWVTQGETVLEIIQIDPIDLIVPVPQTYLPALQEAINHSRTQGTRLKAQVWVDSIPRLLEGEVVRTVPQADLRSRSFPVKIRIRNPKTPTGHLLNAGMLARASLFLGNNEDILLVHKDALVLGGNDISLFVVNENPSTKTKTARLVPVQVGAAIKQWIQVMGDIQAGDQVVSMGNERLQPGQTIEITKELTLALPDVSRLTDPSKHE